MERRYKEARMKEGSEGKDECCYRNGDVYTEGEANRIETKGGEPTDLVQDLGRI